MTGSHTPLLWSPGPRNRAQVVASSNQDLSTDWESPGVHRPPQHSHLAGLLIAGNTHEFTFIKQQLHFYCVGVLCDKVHVCVCVCMDYRVSVFQLLSIHQVPLEDDKYVPKIHVCLLLK